MNRTRTRNQTRTLTQQAFRALNSVVIPLVRTGIGSPPPLAGAGIVLLETTGRTSGRTRRVPLLGLRLGRHTVVSTVRPSSQWVRNLQADPEAGLWLNGRRTAARATVRPDLLTVVHLDAADPGRHEI